MHVRGRSILSGTTYINIYGIGKFFDTVFHKRLILHDSGSWNAIVDLGLASQVSSEKWDIIDNHSPAINTSKFLGNYLDGSFQLIEITNICSSLPNQFSCQMFIRRIVFFLPVIL